MQSQHVANGSSTSTAPRTCEYRLLLAVVLVVVVVVVVVVPVVKEWEREDPKLAKIHKVSTLSF